MIRPFALATVIVALAIGCSGDAGDDAGSTATEAGTSETAVTASPEAPPAETITSDDGKLSLTIPEGAVPEGIEVSIADVAFDDLPPHLREVVGSAMGYRLEPDGLTFDQPVTATLVLDRNELGEPADTQSAYALVSFNDSAGREVLDSDTHVNLADEEVTVTAQLEHFSWITRTKSSLRLSLVQVPRRQAIGVPFTGSFTIEVTTNQVTMTELAVTTLIGGVLEKLPDRPGAATTFSDNGRDSTHGVSYSHPRYQCTKAGLGTYGVNATGISAVTADPNLQTRLAITLESAVECAVGTPEPEEAFPTATPATSSTLIVHLEQTIGCEHTQPGIESELRKRGRVTDANGLPVADLVIGETATGPGLIDEDGDPSAEEEAFTRTDANGEFSLAWRINSFGPYTVTATTLRFDGGPPVALDGTSRTTWSYTVGQPCTPP